MLKDPHELFSLIVLFLKLSLGLMATHPELVKLLLQFPFNLIPFRSGSLKLIILKLQFKLEAYYLLFELSLSSVL